MGVDVCGKDPQLGSRGKRSIAGLVFEGNKCQWHKRTASSCSTVWKDFIGVPGRSGAALTDRIRNSDAGVSKTVISVPAGWPGSEIGRNYYVAWVRR